MPDHHRLHVPESELVLRRRDLLLAGAALTAGATLLRPAPSDADPHEPECTASPNLKNQTLHTEILLDLCWAAFGRGAQSANLGTRVRIPALDWGREKERPFAWTAAANIRKPSDWATISAPYVERWTEIGREAAKDAAENWWPNKHYIDADNVEKGYETQKAPMDSAGNPPALGEHEEKCERRGAYMFVGFGWGVQLAGGSEAYFGHDSIQILRKKSYQHVYCNLQTRRKDEQWWKTWRCARQCGARARSLAGGNAISSKNTSDAWDLVQAAMLRLMKNSPKEDWALGCG